MPKPGETYTIEFIGTRKGFDPSSQPVLDDNGKELRTTRIYSDDIGETLKTVEGHQSDLRLQRRRDLRPRRVTSTADHPNPSEVGDKQQAWVQLMIGPAGPK